MKIKSIVILLLLSSSVLCIAQNNITECIGKEYISKFEILTFGEPLKTHVLDGNIEFICVGNGKDIMGEYGVFKSKNDSTVIIQSNWEFGRFKGFISKAYYEDLVRKYGKKATKKALDGYDYIGMPLMLFIIAKGDPDSWRTVDSKYGKTDILTYMYGDNYNVYTFKNGKLESSNEGF